MYVNSHRHIYIYIYIHLMLIHNVAEIVVHQMIFIQLIASFLKYSTLILGEFHYLPG